jgi:hypothetical protein
VGAGAAQGGNAMSIPEGIAKLALGIGLLAIAHPVYVFVVYRARVLTHAGLWSSDMVVFALPTLLVFGGYIGLLRTRRMSWVVVLIVSIVLTFLSLWVSLLIAFNTSGT